MVIQEPVQANIWHCLNYYAYTDAELLAERLYAEVGTEEALHMLATCYYRSGKPNRAYTLLKNKGCPTPQCRYLLAQCCLDINKLSEAEAALMGNVLLKNKTLEDLINEHGDAACHALRLLGNIYSKTERHTKAKETFNRSLKLNPFLWSSFSNLCKLGEKPDPTKTFALSGQSHNTGCQNVFPIPTPPPTINIPTTINIQSPAPQTPQLPETPAPMNIDSQMESPLATMPNDSQIISPTPEPLSGVGTPENLTMPAMPMAPRTARCNRTSSMLGGPAALSPLTPSFGVLPLENTPSTTPVYSYLFEQSVPEAKPPAVKKQMTRRSQQVHNKPVFSMSGNTNSMRDIQTSCQQQGLQASNTTLRRSSRLFSNSNASSSSVKENNKSQSQNQNKKIAPTRAPVKKSRSKLAKTQELNELNKSDLSDSKPATQSKDVNAQMAQMQKQSAEGLLQLLQQIGKAYVALSQYDCAKAVSLFSALPSHQYSTGWVMCQVGRAYYEMADYKKAEKIFSEVRQLEPHHLDGMEYYSNTLWHLQKEVQLSALAQELTETDKEAPETWCAVGNCFSLQREHDVAIKFFQRAIQVRPNFAYAYTLLGHEYVSTEELDKALACFRNAIRVNPRHFNSWYGVGVVYYKQEKFALAEVHYRKALSINPKNCVLLCHIGDVLHAMKKTDQALATFSQAIKVDPKNELCKFHRASILFSTDRHKEALMELEELKELVPKESTVYFLIGKVHKKLGRTDLALMNFSWAMDLDPKGANNQIKELIDKRYVTDEDDPAAWGEGPSAIEDPMEGSSNNSSSLDTEAVDAEDVQLHAIESDESL